MATYSNTAHFDSIGDTVNVRFPLDLLSRRDQMALLTALLEKSGASAALLKHDAALEEVFRAVQSYQTKEA